MGRKRSSRDDSAIRNPKLQEARHTDLLKKKMFTRKSLKDAKTMDR